MGEFISRRELLKRGSVIAVGLATPGWLSNIAKADVVRLAAGGKVPKDTVLVVCQLSGGNDGLNTVIPWADKQYYTFRPTIGIAEDKVLKLDDHIGLHPAMKELYALFKSGKVAVVQNVGYPNPNRSHFKSMDIWQSASPDSSLKFGWIGRHLDQQLAAGVTNPVMALGLSTEKPLALTGDHASVPCFASLADIQSLVGDPDAEKMLREIQGSDAKAGSATRVVQEASRTALDAMQVLSKQLKTYDPKQTYGDNDFGRGFKQMAQLIATSPATRVVYFSTGGFDTHAKQVEQQEKLLGNLSQAVAAFQSEMEAVGKADKVIIAVFSEFGRRVQENGSQGTDHGTAAPMLLIGNKVKGGVHGMPPNLSDLDHGDLKFQTDFREVYAAVLDDWMGGDSGVVLGAKFNHAPVL